MLNSEIRKYYWQDFSIQRLIGMPAVLLAIVLLVFLGNDSSSEGRSYEPYLFAIFAMQFAFVGITLLWGGMKAANAIPYEVNNNTWDNQRLSSVSPWQLTFGKLVGSTLYNWYGGLIALALYVCISLSLLYSYDFEEHRHIDREFFSLTRIIFNVMNLIIGAILCHAIAMASSMQLVRSGNRYQRANAGSSLIFSLFLIIPIIYSQISGHMYLNRYSRNYYNENTVDWFGMEFIETDFTYYTLCVFAIWAIVAVFRFMREELKFRNIPWVWGAFIIFIMIYFSGMLYDLPRNKSYIVSNPERYIPTHYLFIAFFIGAISTYVSLLSDNISFTRYRIIHDSLKHKNKKKALEFLPKFIVSYVITIIACILLVGSMKSGMTMSAIVLVTSSLIYITRDICILHYFRFSSKNKRATLAAVFYYALLYGLLPAILFVADADKLARCFFPILDKNAHIVMLVPGILQLLIIVPMLISRIKKEDRRMVQ